MSNLPYNIIQCDRISVLIMKIGVVVMKRGLKILSGCIVAAMIFGCLIGPKNRVMADVFEVNSTIEKVHYSAEEKQEYLYVTGGKLHRASGCRSTAKAKNISTIYLTYSEAITYDLCKNCWPNGYITAPSSNPGVSETTPAPETQPEEAGVEGFAERLYTTCLCRNSEPEGKAYWVNELKRGETGANAAQGFFFSEELANQNIDDAEYITRLYRTFMNREADNSGINYWLGEISNGASRESIFYGFVNSPEWADTCLTYGIRSGGSAEPTFVKTPSAGVNDFTTRLYTTCLGRAPEDSGLKYWATELANIKQTGRVAAQGFFFSSEFVGANYSNGEYLNRLYKTFMGREPEASGYKYWLEQLDGGASRESVFDGFACSDEFTQLCSDAGIIA